MRASATDDQSHHGVRNFVFGPVAHIGIISFTLLSTYPPFLRSPLLSLGPLFETFETQIMPQDELATLLPRARTVN